MQQQKPIQPNKAYGWTNSVNESVNEPVEPIGNANIASQLARRQALINSEQKSKLMNLGRLRNWRLTEAFEKDY